MNLPSVRFLPAPAMACVVLASLVPARAIVVGGTDGTGTNNTEEADLQSHLAANSYAPFPYWDNLVRVQDASGVYLGYNPVTMTGWVLSAAHISPDPSTIDVGGSTYTVVSSSGVGTTDLFLYEIGGPLALPTLPAVSMPTAAATPGEFLVMTGRGYTTTTTAPYPWGGAGATDAIPMRWGTNVVEEVGLVDLDPGAGVNLVSYVITDFDSPATPGVTGYEGQGVVGDSGGGIFIYRDGQWQLGGIAHFVGDPDENPTNPVNYGNYTAYTDVFAYSGEITDITGTLVPEPRALILLALAGAAGLRLRRR